MPSSACKTNALAKGELLRRREFETARVDDGDLVTPSDPSVGILIDDFKPARGRPCITGEEKINFHRILMCLMFQQLYGFSPQHRCRSAGPRQEQRHSYRSKGPMLCHEGRR